MRHLAALNAIPHGTHTHHNASVSQNNTPTVLCYRWQKRLLKDYGRAGYTDSIARTRRPKRCLQTFRPCNGASITYVVVVEEDLGDGVVCLVIFSQGTNTGTHLAARMLRRTITQLRGP